MGSDYLLASKDVVWINDDVAMLGLVPGMGGAIVAYRWPNGDEVIDWMRPAGPLALENRDEGHLACFPLVPYSNRIRDGRFSFGGRDI